MMEQIIQNLRDGDPMTALAVVVGVVVLFLLLKFVTGVLKAALILIVVIVGLAIFYPEMHVIDKVQEGSKTVIEKGKALSQKAAELAKDGEALQKAKEKAEALKEKATQ